MNRVKIILLGLVLGGLFANAKSIRDNDKVKVLEEKCSILQNKQVKVENNFRKLVKKQKETERRIQVLVKENEAQRLTIDSLQNKCKSLEDAQSTDRVNFNGKIDATDNNVRTNQDLLQSRTLYGVIVILVVLVVIIGTVYWLTKRIQLGTTSIDDVRKVQNALQVAQAKMQEELVKLDNQLLAVVQKQLDTFVSSPNKTTGEPDHSLVT